MAADKINFSAFGVDELPRKIAEATAAGKIIECGWVPPHARSAAVASACARIDAALPRFTIRGRFSASERRYPLWKAGKAVTGKFLRYNWQQTGSCVGAGGGNMAKTAICVEIAIGGESEEYRELWWPFTYGRSRFRSGIRGKGEGSTGTGWAEAATEDGSFEIDPEGFDFPDFEERDGWLVESAKVEMDWSDGAKVDPRLLTLGKAHLFGSAARIRNKDDAFEAIANGYPLTQASSFGFRGAKVRGTNFPIRVAEWNGTWNHQTYIDEAWDHPELRDVFFRWGNNWGPDAHGAPTGDEPPGGVYISSRTMDQLCKEGEVYAFSKYDGFPARELNFNAF